MFINPRTAIKEGWVKYPEWMSIEQQEKCLQPNALDWTVDDMSEINNQSWFAISENKKTMRDLIKIHPNSVNCWSLSPGRCYDIMSDFYISVPAGIAALLITRSTFVRNGVFIQSGIFDSGYEGPAGAVLFNMGGSTLIEPHTRIAQIAFVKSESNGLYAGGYNTDAGVHWTETLTNTKETK